MDVFVCVLLIFVVAPIIVQPWLDDRKAEYRRLRREQLSWLEFPGEEKTFAVWAAVSDLARTTVLQHWGPEVERRLHHDMVLRRQSCRAIAAPGCELIWGCYRSITLTIRADGLVIQISAEVPESDVPADLQGHLFRALNTGIRSVEIRAPEEGSDEPVLIWSGSLIPGDRFRGGFMQSGAWVEELVPLLRKLVSAARERAPQQGAAHGGPARAKAQGAL